MKKLFLVLLLVTVLIFSINFNNKSSNNQSSNIGHNIIFTKLSADYPIVNITNNSDLQALASSGSGTFNSPYIVGFFTINNCSTFSTGVNIQNTDKYFILTNVTITGCYIGINLQNVTYGSIINSSIINSTSIGISLNGTSYTDLDFNQVTFSDFGYSILNSHWNTFDNNTVLSINTDCFSLYLSHNNNFTKNWINFVNNTGFRINSSMSNNFINNSVFNSQSFGFQLFNASSNTFTINTLNNCSIGFDSNISNNNIFTSNNIKDSNQGFYIQSSVLYYLDNNYIGNSALSGSVGIILLSSSSNTINGNTVFNMSSGCNLVTNSNYNNVTNNIASNMYGTYFAIYSSTGNYLQNNSILGSNSLTESGFVIDNSDNNILVSNHANMTVGNIYYLESSSFNTLVNNTGLNSQNSCFQLTSSSNNTFINNIADSCVIGINLQSSFNNTFQNNTVTNGGQGFQLESSLNNTLIGNYGSNNTLADYIDLSSLSNTLIQNKFTSKSNTTNTTSAIPPPGPVGTNGIGNLFGLFPEDVTFPEITVLTLLLLLPFIGLYAYRKTTGSSKKSTQSTNLRGSGYTALNFQPDFTYDKKTPSRLIILGPLLTLFATIYYSRKHRNLDYFDLKENELRGRILTILEDQHFIHFNKLREILKCGVSILKWHIQVLNEFKVVNWSTIGQYKVIYLVEKPPSKKEVNLFYSITNDKVILILEHFLKQPTWNVDKLASKTLLRKDSILHHCKKLSSTRVLLENKQTHEFTLPGDTKEMLKKLLFKKVYYNSSRHGSMRY